MKYIIANWKMNMNVNDVQIWLSNFGDLLKTVELPTDLKIIIAASHTHLKIVSDFTQNYPQIFAAAQNVSIEEKGAHTGENGAFQVKDFCDFCIVGHSERKESLETVTKKRDECLKHQITPVVCFNEIDELNALLSPNTIFAWEDPKNISKNGVYSAPTPEATQNMYKEFAQKFPQEKIIYGGSVNRQNVDKLVTIPNVGGVLPGHASLDPQHFIDIIKAF